MMLKVPKTVNANVKPERLVISEKTSGLAEKPPWLTIRPAAKKRPLAPIGARSAPITCQEPLRRLLNIWSITKPITNPKNGRDETEVNAK